MSNSDDFEIVNGELQKYRGQESNVVVPAGVASIGSYAFKYCFHVTSITLQDGLKSIQNYAFSGCSNLTSIILPEGLTIIGYRAFEDCRNLKAIDLPDSVEVIRDYAFSGCMAISRIKMSKQIKTIKQNAFTDTSFFLTQKNWTNGLLLIGKALVKADPEFEGDLTVGEDIVCIADDAFSSCSKLTGIELPDCLQQIGKNTFFNCSNLSKIVIPDGIKAIGDNAFSACISLTEISIPDSVESIGDFAFSSCTRLTSIKIPSHIHELGAFAFHGCISLEQFDFPEGQTEISRNMFENCSHLRSVRLPNSIISIKDDAFSNCSSLTELTLPENVEKIGVAAFARCSKLAELAIPDSVQTISARAFSECTSLTSIRLPERITAIGQNAFENCKNLSEISLPEHLTQISSGAFKGCDALHLTLPGSVTETQEALSGELARSRIETTDAGYAHLLLFQRTPLWRAWRNSFEPVNPANVFAYMLTIIQAAETPDKKMGAPIADYIMKNRSELKREQILEMLALFKGLKCKEIDALQKDEGLQAYLAGKEETENPIEAEALALLAKVGADPSVEKAVSKGIHYRNSKIACSREALIAILSYYAKEWERCSIAEGADGAYAGVQILRDASKVQIEPLVDQIAGELDAEELSAFLEKRVASSSYRPYLLSWARFASEGSVENVTSTYRSKLRGRAPEQYFARNLAEALMVSPTRAAMLFFNKNDLLDRFAMLKGTTAMELRDTKMLPDFGFDPTGAKLFDIGGNIIEVRLTDRLGFELFDREKGKAVRAFPKKSSNPAKAQAAAEAYKDFKKQIMDFAKLRTEQLCRMHQSGEKVRPGLWQEVYLKHPVVKLLAERLIWMDEAGTSFILKDGAAKDAALNPVEPTGPVHVAHVMDLSAAQADAWRHTLASLGRAQLFEQVWEPVIAWETQDLSNRYRGVEISSKVRNVLKATLKQRGIDVHAGEMDREFDAHRWSYEFSSDNTMYFGKCFRLDYTVYETNGDLTLGKSSLGEQPNARELNAVLLELDRITALERVKQDDPNVMQWMDEFTLAQITEFISAAQEASATNVLAALLEYKNTHFADFDPMDEFTLEW